MSDSKNYKENLSHREMEKKGQAAIFIIVAIVLIAIIALGVLFYPRIQEFVAGELSPNAYLKECVEPVIRENLGVLAKQGGYFEPEGFIMYQGNKIKYLCYTSDYYKTCVVQQPLIKQQFENELNSLVSGKARECINNLAEEYKSRGYEVSSSGNINSEVRLNPGEIIVKVNSVLSVQKDLTERFDGFEIKIDSEMYDLLLTASSIIDFESGLGDSASELYLQYYPDLSIEKTKLSDGTTIYKLSNVITKEEFVFASRSLAWPPGYGLEEIR